MPAENLRPPNLALKRLESTPKLGSTEVFLTVGLAWLLVASVGALLYIIDGNGIIVHPVHAMFESMSDFNDHRCDCSERNLVRETFSFRADVAPAHPVAGWDGYHRSRGSDLLAGGRQGMQLMEAEALGLPVEKLSPPLRRQIDLIRWIIGW